jgi:hypothetical protein
MENQKHKTETWLVLVLLAGFAPRCHADVFVGAPTGPGGQVGGPGWTETFFPFFLQQIQLNSMRYQQVYNASVFSNVPPESIYVTTLTFLQGYNQQGSTILTVTNMQINLSTSQRAADNLSTNFAENVAPDDTIVYGPARQDFNNVLSGSFRISLDRPFRYNPASGNLLLDVHIFNGAGPVVMNLPRLTAFDPATDESSRVWSTNVAAAVADGADTTGLETVIQFSPVPSLQIYRTSQQGANVIVVRWPAQPSAFVLQYSVSLGADVLWEPVGNYDHGSEINTLIVPFSSLNSSSFYRLIWEAGQPVQPANVPVSPADARGTHTTK